MKETILGSQPGYERYVIECAGQIQGAAYFNIADYHHRQPPARGLVYVEFLATAPWNRAWLQSPPEYRRVGQTMLVWAVVRSDALGYQGSIGLHSLPNAEAFYERQMGMTRYGPDPQHENLVYFELLATAAQALLATWQGEKS